MKFPGLSFLFATLSLIISIIVVILFFYTVGPNSVVDLGTFIGVSTAIIGIMVTLLIGYQIYNAVDIRQKLSAIDKLKEELQETTGQMKSMENELYQSIYILQARISATRQNEYTNAFVKFNSAILYALEVDHHEDGYDWIMKELMEYINLLDIGIFSGCGVGYIDRYISNSQEDIKLIRAHKNFYIIREKYNQCIDKFLSKMEEIRQHEFLLVRKK